MPTKRATVLALGVSAAAVLGGCGSQAPAARAPDGVIRVRLDEYTVRPASIDVPAGRVRIVATNDGKLTHNLAIVSPQEEQDDPEVQFGRTTTAHPGQTVRNQAPIRLRPGTYRLACTLANHDNLGQYGTLKVTG